jgi:signal transduction histidine kinase
MFEPARVLLQSRPFVRWIQRQDRAAVEGITLAKRWFQTTAVVTIIIAVAAWAPGASSFFALSPLPSFLSWLPTLLFTRLQIIHFRRMSIGSELGSDPMTWLLIVAGSLAIQFFCASLVAASAAPGGWMFGAILLYAVGFHGFLFRISHESAFFLVGTLLVILVAAAFATTMHARLVLLLLAIPAVFVEWVSGTFALRQDEARAERERFRAAIQAQQLESEAARARHLEETVVDLLSHGHEARNTLMGAALEVDALDELSRDGVAIPGPVAQGHVASLKDALGRITELTLEMRDQGRDDLRAELAVVDARKICLDACNATRGLFPGTRLEFDLPTADELPVALSGGPSSLRSVIDNLLLNSCQGDGKRGASKVRVHAERDQTGAVLRLFVDDDGPGFPAEQLARPIEAFATTKANGTGLGLFTTERLVKASGGDLKLDRSPLGGARVEVRLKLGPL